MAGDVMTWVLDWNRIANLLVVLTPFFLSVGGGFAFLVKRSDARAERMQDAANKARLKIEQEREKNEEARDERRAAEAEEMRRDRAAFFEDILKESRRSAENAQRMRQLYEAEAERALALRVALAEAAQREFTLQTTITDLTRKVDQLQDVVSELRSELAKVQAKETA